MTDVASRELRNNTRSILERAAGGERIVITVDGRPIVELRPVGKPRFVPKERLLRHQADPGLSADLHGLTGDETTDDLRDPWSR